LAGTEALVVDSSVAIKWFAEEEDTTIAMQVLACGVDLIAPVLILTETASGLWKKCRIGALPSESARKALWGLERNFRQMITASELLQEAFELSLRYDHPIYDCFYAALAIQRELPFVTADRRLLNKFSSFAFPRSPVLLSDWSPQ
jgi:predicted nucleic acid-binding protein